MAKAAKTVGVLTSGGDASGMNAAVHAVVRTAINKGLKVKDIIRGYTGLLEERIVDMESTSMSDIINRGGTILYTARCKEFIAAEGQRKGADIRRKHGVDGTVVIGGDGSFRGARGLSSLGINTIGLPGTIDLDIAYTDYTIGFGTAVSTAMEAIDKIHDTSTFHGQCNVTEVMGRNARYITLRCGIGNGAEDILLPECHDGNEQVLINRIIDNRRRGKKHNTIINAKGIGHSGFMVECIEAAMDIETRAIIPGRMQRGGMPACKDRVYASIVGAKITEPLAAGESSRLIAYRRGKFVDFDIQEILNMTKDIPGKQYGVAKTLIRQSGT